MNKDDILKSLQKWEEIRRDSSSLVDYLKQGNCFKFTNHKYPASSRYRHAYPGIDEGKLKMFVIPSAYDNNNTKNIASYVEVCDVFVNSEPIYHSMNNNDRISHTTAVRRVDRWNENYATWVPKDVATTEGIFQAFAIPSQDFVTEKVKVHFALQKDKKDTEKYNADMVVACDDGTTIYEDFSDPVPPFGGNNPQSSFYLLSQV